MDRIIYLANHKCHALADFSFGMKLALGLVHPMERVEFHKEHLCEKVVETVLAVSPDLTLIDAKLSMITGGPAEGKVVSADRFFIGHSPAEVDLKAYRLMYDLKKKNNETGSFLQDPFKMKQFVHAERTGLLGKMKEI